MFGEPLDFDKSKIGILCGGSQKALSAPAGLTMVWISKAAMRIMENRKTPIASFYCNILVFKDYYKNQWFPYTMPISDITGLRIALENVQEDDDIYNRHAKIAEATRKAITDAGLKLYLDNGFSNTVTVFCVPTGLTDKEILDTLTYKYGVMISGCFDVLAGKVVRIGHMGENANIEDMKLVMSALDETFKDLGYPLKKSLKESFEKYI